MLTLQITLANANVTVHANATANANANAPEASLQPLYKIGSAVFLFCLLVTDVTDAVKQE